MAAKIISAESGSGEKALPVMQIVCSRLHHRLRETGGSRIDSAVYEKEGGARGAP